MFSSGSGGYGTKVGAPAKDAWLKQALGAAPLPMHALEARIQSCWHLPGPNLGAATLPMHALEARTQSCWHLLSPNPMSPNPMCPNPMSANACQCHAMWKKLGQLQTCGLDEFELLEMIANGWNKHGSRKRRTDLPNASASPQTHNSSLRLISLKNIFRNKMQ